LSITSKEMKDEILPVLYDYLRKLEQKKNKSPKEWYELRRVAEDISAREKLLGIHKSSENSNIGNLAGSLDLLLLLARTRSTEEILPLIEFFFKDVPTEVIEQIAKKLFEIAKKRKE